MAKPAKGQTRTFAKSAKPMTPEDRFQAETVAFMRTALPGAVVAHAANERTASARLGRVDGYPDLIIHWRGITVGLELKAPGRKLRAAQSKCHRLMAKQGVQVWVASTPGDLRAIASAMKAAVALDRGPGFAMPDPASAPIFEG